MGKIAFVFSGQGAQHAGMGQDFYTHHTRVKELFDQAEQHRPGTLQQCFHGDAATLQQTENTQPCLYLTDLAAAIALQDMGIYPDALAGFSLGEIPALAFGGAFSWQQGFEIACRRGAFMAQAASQTPASMRAVVKLDHAVVEALCAKYLHVYPVNYNAPGQLVVSGVEEELSFFQNDVRAAGGRVIALPVGGGFHAPFMDEAAEKFRDYLSDIPVVLPKTPVYSNCTAQPYTADAKCLMKRQINHPVQWQTLIQNLIAQGVDTFIECGVGATLQKLIGKIAPNTHCYSVEDTSGLQAVQKELSAC